MLPILISCPEEIAYRQGYISADQVRKTAEALANCAYRKYLMGLIEKPNW